MTSQELRPWKLGFVGCAAALIRHRLAHVLRVFRIRCSVVAMQVRSLIGDGPSAGRTPFAW